MRLLLLVLLALAPALAAAQAADGSRRGDVALVAALTDVSLVNLSPRLAGVGVRYGLADRLVLGGTVGLDASSDDGDVTQDGYGVTAVVWTESHLGPQGRRVSPFVGVQLLAAVSDWTSTQDASDVSVESERAAASLGAVGGAEIVVLSRLSVSAAVWAGVGVERTELRREGFGLPPETIETRRLSVGTGGTALRISVYF